MRIEPGSPGWETGRSFYTGHVTLADQPELKALAETCARTLEQLPMLGPVPLEWLHLTVQGVGFTDEVTRSDINSIVRGAQSRCAVLQPVTVSVGPPQLDAETIQMAVRPVEQLASVRGAIRAAIADVSGEDQVPEAAGAGARTSHWPAPTSQAHLTR